jgi:hypothetical protein
MPNIKIFGGAREAAYDNMAHGRFMLDSKGYTHSCTTHTHARAYTQTYVILIAFQRQQLFRESAFVLLYMYIVSLYTFSATHVRRTSMLRVELESSISVKCTLCSFEVKLSLM